MADEAGKSRRVAIVYHYFAHYRRPVFFELIEHGEHHYEFLGCDHAFGSGIKLIEDFPEGRFRKIRGWWPGPFLLQPGAVLAAIGSRYDTLVLLGDSKWPTTWLAAIAGRLRGKRVLMWTHGWLREEYGLQRRFRDRFYKLASGLLLYHNRAKSIGIAHGFRPERMHVIYNSLDTKAQRAVADEITDAQVAELRSSAFPGSEGTPIVVSVTRLLPEKKLDQLIDAAAVLKERGSPINVMIAGDGPERERLEAQARDKGVRVHFAGAVYDERVLGTMFRSADLTVMPGAIGLLVMHSLVFGTPVVSHNNFDRQGPEYEAIVEGVTGGFFEEDSVESLADAIAKWTSDDSVKARGRDESRSIIDRFYNPSTQRELIDRAVSGRPPEVEEA
ncbi:MAG: glycosyltransferase [Phycisphaerales bacterium]|nr:glycosyltransferase [Phycisphaerales bacterium]